MQYISIDIETTGLDHERDQVLQIALIVENTEAADVVVEELPSWEGLVYHKRIKGDPFALSLNAEIIDIFADVDVDIDGYEDEPTIVKLRGREVRVYPYLDTAIDCALDFISINRIGGKHQMVAAGKNVANFDLPFLGDLFRSAFHYHVIDVGSVALGADAGYWESHKIPGLANLRGGAMSHDALEDARDVIRILRKLTNGYRG